MKRFDLTRVVMLMTAVLVALPVVGVSQENKDDKNKKEQYRLTLSVEGVECAKCAQVMTSTLEGAQLQPTGAIKPDSTGPSRIVATCPSVCDLGAAAAKVNQADTPHREKVPPSLSLILFTKLDEKSASTALATCRKIEGVDGTACQADSKTGEIQLKISGKEKVTVAQILTALKDAGIEAHTTTATGRVETKAGA